VLYVWFDAPIGYISNTKELCDAQPEKYGTWEKWWKDNDTRLIHFIGKDNIVFHCIVFPSMLKADGSYILPDNVPSNEFLNLEGDKISTSRNWAVWLNEYLVDFPNKQDVLRYVLTANAPETKDNDFTWADFQARNNNELVAIYGNFVNRALVLTKKYFNGAVPALGTLTEYDQQTLQECEEIKGQLQDLLEHFRFRDAQKVAMNMARIGNKYLADTEPWKVAKEDMARTGTILNIALQIAANLSIAFEPFLPFSSHKLHTMLNMPQTTWEDLGNMHILPEGHALGEVSLLFEKIEDETIQYQLDRLARIKAENEKKAQEEALKHWVPAEYKPDTNIDEFAKTDIRVGTVLECTRVKKSDRLLQLRIDDGTGVRTILSGIAASYPNPEELVGKQILFIANFPPRKMMGIESQGMVLSAVDADGKLVVTTVTAPVKNGSQVG
jgi:methionyl-tRNA synthetase